MTINGDGSMSRERHHIYDYQRSNNRLLQQVEGHICDDSCRNNLLYYALQSIQKQQVDGDLRLSFDDQDGGRPGGC